jgi:hypothetical protein
VDFDLSALGRFLVLRFRTGKSPHQSARFQHAVPSDNRPRSDGSALQCILGQHLHKRLCVADFIFLWNTPETRTGPTLRV